MEKMSVSKKLSFGVRVSNDTTKYIHGDTTNELIDAIEELKDVEFIIKFIEEFKNLSKEQLERLENVVLNSNDTDNIYKYALNEKISLINTEKFEDIIIETGDNMKITTFAERIQGANIEKLEDAVIKSKHKRSILDFFCIVRGSNVDKIKKALFDGEKSAEAIYDFIIAKQNRGYIVDIDEIKEVNDVIIASNNANLCRRWAERNMEGIDISKLEDIVIKCNNTYDIRDFAINVKGANIEKLEEAIIKIDAAHAIYYFAKEIQGANLYKLRKALKSSKDPDKEKYIGWWKEEFGMKGLFKNN